MVGTHPDGPAPMMSRSHCDSVVVVGLRVCFLLPNQVPKACNMLAALVACEKGSSSSGGFAGFI